jgi:hypothetical protein
MDVNIVNHGYPNELNEEIGVVEQKITFIQHSDTNDDDRYQYLNVQTSGVDFDPKDNTDSFFRISTGDPFAYDDKKTDCAPFWSCNGPEELVAMFNEAARRFGMSCRWKLEKYHVKPIVGPIKEKILTDIELEKIEETYKNAQQQDKRYTSTPDE